MERTRVDWEMDGQDVVLRIELRMTGEWFLQRAHEIYSCLSALHRPPGTSPKNSLTKVVTSETTAPSDD